MTRLAAISQLAFRFFIWVLLLGCTAAATADDVVTLESVVDPGKIAADEALAEEFSPTSAARYLDSAALHWQKSRKCVTCHTNLGYLFARPALHSAQEDSGEVRAFYEEHVTSRWAESTPAPVQSVVVAAGLTFNDVQTTGKLHPTTRRALDLMWTVQREDGAWNWPICDWPPMESDEHYGVTLAALAVGLAPNDYSKTEAATEGLEKIRTFLANNPPKSLHHRAMVAWASLRVDGLASTSERQQTLADLFARQLPDGGWATPGLLSDWTELKRKDGKPHDTETSDAYATGFAIVVARELGCPATDERLEKGIDWITQNQRESGKWFTRSPAKDSHHYLSNFGSAFAILALQSCEQLPGWPLGTGAE